VSALRRLSREIKSPVIVISSMNRAAYGDPTKPPTMTALKESGGIEYTADGVICLWRNRDESKIFSAKDGRDNALQTDCIEAYVLKNRNGELSKITLKFTKPWASFKEENRYNLTDDII